MILNNTDDLTKYWEIEDISSDTNMTTQEQFCEEYYVATTSRLDNGKYQVKLPMKENFDQQLGKSKQQAVAQFMNLEKKLIQDSKLSESYKKFIAEYLSMGHMKESFTDKNRIAISLITACTK